MQDNHRDILLEDIQSKLQLLLELAVPTARDVAEMKPRVARLTEDMEVVKAVQKDQGRDLKRLNDRMGHVETKLSKVETRLGRVENKLGHVESYLVEQGMPQRA